MRADERLGLDVCCDLQAYNKPFEGEYVLNIEPYDKLVVGSKWTGAWLIDLLLTRDWRAGELGVVDDIFLAVGYLPDTLKPFKDRTTIMFQACDPVLHRRIPDIPQEYDFVMSGSMGEDCYTERRRVYDVMKEKYTHKDYGKNHKPEAYVQNINAARVQFIRSMGDKDHVGEIAQRFFECVGIGTVLTNYTPDIEHTGFVDGYDVMTYSEDGEMIEKMDYLLKHPHIREKMAERSRKKMLAYHTYEHRLITLLKALHGNTGV